MAQSWTGCLEPQFRDMPTFSGFLWADGGRDRRSPHRAGRRSVVTAIS